MTLLATIGDYARRVLYLAVYSLFAVLPMDSASALGSWLARTIGPCLGVQRLARHNLERAFPDKSAAEIDIILHDMWDNLGRVFGEFPHIGRLDIYNDPRIEVIGREYIDQMRDDNRPGIFFTAHLGNWELSGYGVIQRGPFASPLAVVYRAPNDPAAEWLLQYGRKRLGIELIPKGTPGARRIIEILRAGGHVSMLPDQKMNNGIAAPFFGRPAMTAPALAQLALKFDCAILPGHVERLGGTRLRLTVHPPLDLPRSGNREADVLALTTTVNRMMEDWIRQNPGQWLWVHRRWPD